MKLSAKTEYACLAALELASRHPLGGPTRIATIAERHGIPTQFLVQILLQLKNAGLVASTRGAGGGYRLCRHPDEIRLAEVIDVVEGPAAPTSNSPESPFAAPLLEIFEQATRAAGECFASISLGELAGRGSAMPEGMYYI